MNPRRPPQAESAQDRGPTRIDTQRDLPNLAGGTAAPTAGADAGAFEPACPGCGGAGWLKEAVPVGHPHFGMLFPCRCKQTEQARRRMEELRRLSNLGAFRNLTFATFNPFVPGLRAVVPRVVAYARQPEGWLTLLGPCGVGKTHLAAAIANEALDRGEQVLFAVVPDLLDHLRATFGPQSTVAYDERFERIRSAPLLVLDDLGAESATAWAQEKLYQLINHRYNERLATVFTSNLRSEAIEPRICSRLCDPSRGSLITVVAQDYRRRPMHERT